MRGVHSKSKGQIRLSAPTTTELSATPDTWKAIAGVFVDGQCNCFTLSADGILTYNGDKSQDFLFSGASDLQADKNCILTYGLYVNGTLVGEAQTPVTIDHANSFGSIGITSIVNLSKDDYLQIWVKSDTANTDVGVQTLNVTLWGEF